MQENSREKFVRLAEKRTDMVRDKIRILTNLSNANLYTYTEKDIVKIFRAIEKDLRIARAKFSSHLKDEKFSLT